MLYTEIHPAPMCLPTTGRTENANKPFDLILIYCKFK